MESISQLSVQISREKVGASPAIPIVLVRETIAAPGNEARATEENTNQRHGLPLLVRITVKLKSMWSTPTEGRRII